MNFSLFQRQYSRKSLLLALLGFALMPLWLSQIFVGCQAVETTTTASRSAQKMVASDHDGYGLYQQHCASCHAEDGQGVDEEYDEPLFGDRSITSLARYIERRMPDEVMDR